MRDALKERKPEDAKEKIIGDILDEIIAEDANNPDHDGTRTDKYMILGNCANSQCLAAYSRMNQYTHEPIHETNMCLCVTGPLSNLSALGNCVHTRVCV